jgi:hypothetical protein
MKLPVYLYPNVYEVILDLDNNNRINQVMYQRKITLQKGVKNTVQLQFKNSDQKLLNVSSSTFVFVLFDSTDQRNLIQKSVTILDNGSTLALRGLGQVVFTESDLNECESTYYKIGIKALDTDGSYAPAYANTYYEVAGTAEVKHDLYPTLVPSQEINRNQFDVYYNADISFRRYEYYSGNLDAAPQFKSNTALHTAAVYMTNYKGQVLIEGTLENDPATFGNYATISSHSYNGFSGIDYTNFNGIFSKVRIRYIPEKNPVSQQNNDIGYAGTVDRVLYRS